MISFQLSVCDAIPEGDPLEAFRAASRPFAVGKRFWLDPGDPSDSKPLTGRIALRFPASTAFGTGSRVLALAALGARRWQLSGRRTEGEWVCLCLERAS